MTKSAASESCCDPGQSRDLPDRSDAFFFSPAAPITKTFGQDPRMDVDT
jgi:hypothetical protein